MNKSFNILPDSGQSATDTDMELINAYSQKELKKDDVFIFSVILCDNEIDRDFERFTVQSLQTLSKLFVGKTAIKNHSMNSDDQSARTFKTEVVTDSERKNSLGEAYVYLKAYCYMPKIPKNESLIAEIQAGIKKEVSVGCAVGSNICSICGTDLRKGVCSHKKGKRYKGRLCYSELVNPTDAYEWSFVAVPAQKNAGVTKNYSYKEARNMNDILKALKETRGEVSLNADEARELAGCIEDLRKKAKDGEEYRKSLESETVRLFALTMPSISNDCTESIVKSLVTEDLKQLKTALGEKKENAVKAPQLYREKGADSAEKNSQFRF